MAAARPSAGTVATRLPGIGEAAMIGVEAPLWTETLRTMADVEYMAFPRLLGIAEIGWLPAGRGTSTACAWQPTGPGSRRWA